MGLVNKFLEFIGIDDPEEELDEEGMGFEEEPAPAPRYGAVKRTPRAAASKRQEEAFEEEAPVYEPAPKPVQQTPVRRSAAAPARQQQQPVQQSTYPAPNGSKMIVYHPVSYEDTQNIIDNIKNRKPVIVNMEELEIDVAQRILDFLSGAVYALDGTMSKISRGIFIVAPANYAVVGSNEDDYDAIYQS